MLIVIPKPHKFVAGEAPTLTTSDEVKVLHSLTPCKKCGLLKKGEWHI